jgi:hypothetical protein
MSDRIIYILIGLGALVVSALLFTLGVGVRSYIDCNRAPSGAVGCRVEQRVFNLAPLGQPTDAADVEEVVADEVCESRFNAEGDLETTCSWAVIFRGPGDAVQAPNFGRGPAQQVAAEVGAFLDSEQPTLSTASTNPSRALLFGGLLAPVTAIFGGLMVWMGFRKS